MSSTSFAVNASSPNFVKSRLLKLNASTRRGPPAERSLFTRWGGRKKAGCLEKGRGGRQVSSRALSRLERDKSSRAPSSATQRCARASAPIVHSQPKGGEAPRRRIPTPSASSSVSPSAFTSSLIQTMRHTQWAILRLVPRQQAIFYYLRRMYSSPRATTKPISGLPRILCGWSTSMPFGHAIELGERAVQDRLSRAHVLICPGKREPHAATHEHL